MKIRRSRPAALAVATVFALSSAGALAQSDGAKAPSDVKIYKGGDLSAAQYQVVSRLWSESWRTAFWVPTFPTQDEAVAALQAEAARRGAEGLINVVCIDQGPSKWTSNPGPAYLCYGNAIQVLPAKG